jgi:hypothetical protein
MHNGMEIMLEIAWRNLGGISSVPADLSNGSLVSKSCMTLCLKATSVISSNSGGVVLVPRVELGCLPV